MNEEINKINTDQKKSGWTKWALLAALATMSWLLINQFEDSNLDFLKLQIILIIITFSFFLISNLNTVFQIKSFKSDNLRYHTGQEVFSDSRKHLFVLFIWYSIILFFIINNKNLLSESSLYLSYFIIAFYIGGFFNSFLIKKNKLIIFPIDPLTGAISSSIMKWFVRIISLTLIGIIIYSGFDWVHISLENKVFQIDIIKIALLIIGIVIVTYLIFSQSLHSNFLNTLVQIRRDLVLTNKSNEEISKEIDKAINGHKLETYLGTDVSEIESYNKLFEKELNQINQTLSEIKENNDEESLFTEQKKDYIFRSLVFASKIEFDQIEKNFKKIQIKDKVFRVITRNNKSHQLQLESISERNNKNVEKYNFLVKEYFLLIKKIDGENSAKKMIRELMKFVPKLKYSEETGEIII